MQKNSKPLFLISFLLTFLQAYVLAFFISEWQMYSGLIIALLVWLAFIMPMVAAGAMWNNDSRKISFARFYIQSGYQLVLFTLFGLVLSYWT